MFKLSVCFMFALWFYCQHSSEKGVASVIGQNELGDQLNLPIILSKGALLLLLKNVPVRSKLCFLCRVYPPYSQGVLG